MDFVQLRFAYQFKQVIKDANWKNGIDIHDIEHEWLDKVDSNDLRDRLFISNIENLI